MNSKKLFRETYGCQMNVADSEVKERGYPLCQGHDNAEHICEIIPDCSISTDIFAGFCSETEEDHQETLSFMERAGFDMAFMFKYSERTGTYASFHLQNNIPEKVKLRRLNEIIELQNRLSLESNDTDIGKSFEVLKVGISKKIKNEYFGRHSQNKIIVFPNLNFMVGNYVNVMIENCTQTTLIGQALINDHKK